jgi:crossover junction endodeoxyribonuclease RusA
MFPFEFVVEGIPVSANVKYRTGRAKDQYRKWMRYVGESAAQNWLPGTPPSSELIVVEFFYFHSKGQVRDADNIAKPILDGLKSLVYVDDNQITDLIIRKRDISGNFRLRETPLQLAAKVQEGDDFVYVKIDLAHDLEDLT